MSDADPQEPDAPPTDAAPSRARGAWPHLRAAFVVFHLAAVVVLSLPASARMANKAAWTNPNAQAEFATWTERLNGFGAGLGPNELQDTLWGVAQRWLALRGYIAAPFVPYARHMGVRQGWAMFSNPQKHPAWIRVDLREGGRWRVLYEARSPEHTWQRRRFDHNRVRKMNGRFARTFSRVHYDGFARWLATQAARDFPQATHARVVLRRAKSRTPDEVRAERPVAARDTQTRVFNLKELR